jgi:phosphoenolpyruvate carboxylase
MSDEMGGEARSARAELEALWIREQARGRADAFTNAYLLFALDLTRRMESGAFDPPTLSAVVQSISAEGFFDRAERLSSYLGDGDPAAALRALFARLADRGFAAFAAALERPAVGLVTTGHPTFALSEALSTILVELATGRDAAGAPLSEADRDARRREVFSVSHGPPAPLNLEVEHAWSLRALANAVDALDVARREALAVARRRWPDRWTELRPRLMTLATWVGFDTDGRSDLSWTVSFGKRLELKRAALTRYVALAEPLGGAIGARLERALALVEAQLTLLAAVTDDPASIAAFSRTLVETRTQALCDPEPLLADIDAALAGARDDAARETLIVLRTNLETQGVCLAHIHVRLNAAQLHNSVRRDVGLETSPADPANRRSYFQAVNALIEGCVAGEVGFKSLLTEPASARRLFMTLAQMARYVDAVSPVRFLIAETESGFTLLAALYLAKLYGVDGLVEISPLFETEEGLGRGELVVAEALKSRSFQSYVKGQGRLAVEFGFSDSGRFIGQLAATFRIERLRLRLAQLVEDEGLCGLEVILFNTHGESLGRGGHPGGLADRWAYAAPPRNRHEFARRGILVREEDSFQGGEGYLPLFTPPAALACVAAALTFGLEPGQEVEDPIYDAPDFAAEFFATVQQSFSQLARQGEYAALLGLFGTRLLARTGSRPDQRQSGESAAAHTFTSVSELRAIPNNGILQGLFFLANTTFGVARAAAKDPETFKELRRASPRFSRALELAETAAALSDLQATRAYAATVNPSVWLDQVLAEPPEEGGLPVELLRKITHAAERAGLTGRLSNVLRQMRLEPAMPPPRPSARRARLTLLHALRIALIQRIAVLAARVPAFTPRAGFTVEDCQLQLMRLDIPPAVARLAEVFPIRSDGAVAAADFGEPHGVSPADGAGYALEHETLFEPLLELHALVLKITAALNHECGACG